jgi:hypothetical protein
MAQFFDVSEESQLLNNYVKDAVDPNANSEALESARRNLLDEVIDLSQSPVKLQTTVEELNRAARENPNTTIAEAKIDRNHYGQIEAVEFFTRDNAATGHKTVMIDLNQSSLLGRIRPNQ